MISNGNEIFRCMDHGIRPEKQESIAQLKSHLEHGVLSPYEKQIRGVVSKAVMNLISPHYISVYGGEEYEDMFDPVKYIGLSMFANSHIIGIIIESPYKANDHIATNGTKHNVIDANAVPIEERKISGIVINLKELSLKDIQEIISLGKKYKIPVYKSSLVLIDNEVFTELTELFETKKDPSS